MGKEAIGRLLKQQLGILKGILIYVDQVCGVYHIYHVSALCSHEGEMYKSLLSDYEASQRALMVENTELKKVLQQMKKEIIHILSSRQPSVRGATADDGQEQVLKYHCV